MTRLGIGNFAMIDDRLHIYNPKYCMATGWQIKKILESYPDKSDIDALGYVITWNFLKLNGRRRMKNIHIAKRGLYMAFLRLAEGLFRDWWANRDKEGADVNLELAKYYARLSVNYV